MRAQPLPWLLCTLLAACARPEVQVETADVERALGTSAAVGLVEVHRANTGNTLGLSLGETFAESMYCTGTLLADGRVLTSTDCLRNANGNFGAAELEYHWRQPGAPRTDHHRVARVDTVETFAYLTLDPEISVANLGRASAYSTGDLPLDERSTSVRADVISLSSPDRDGIARATHTQVTVEYSPTGHTVTFTDTSTATSTSTATGTAISPRPNLGPATGTAVRTETRTETRVTTESAVFRAPNLPAGNPGAAIVVGGRLVGITKNPGTRSGLDQVTWMDKRRPRAPDSPPVAVPPPPTPGTPPAPRPEEPRAPSAPPEFFDI